MVERERYELSEIPMEMLRRGFSRRGLLDFLQSGKLVASIAFPEEESDLVPVPALTWRKLDRNKFKAYVRRKGIGRTFVQKVPATDVAAAIDLRLKRLLHAIFTRNIDEHDRETAREFLNLENLPQDLSCDISCAIHDAAINLLFRVRNSADDLRPVWVRKSDHDAFFSNIPEMRKRATVPRAKSRKRLSELDNVMMDLVERFLMEPDIKQYARLAEMIEWRDAQGITTPSDQWLTDHISALDKIFSTHLNKLAESPTIEERRRSGV